MPGYQRELHKAGLRVLVRLAQAWLIDAFQSSCASWDVRHRAVSISTRIVLVDNLLSPTAMISVIKTAVSKRASPTSNGTRKKQKKNSEPTQETKQSEGAIPPVTANAEVVSSSTVRPYARR